MNYTYAALDFIYDKHKDLYFIEANSSPGALKEYKKIYPTVKPVKELCKFLNKYKTLAVISRGNWNKTIVSKEFKKYFKGNINFCPYEKNRKRMKEGDGSLITSRNKIILPDVVLRAGAGIATAQEKAGIKVINPLCISRLTLNKLKTQKIVKENTNVKVPKSFKINKKSDIKKIVKNTLTDGFVLKPLKGQKSQGLYIFHSYEEIPKDFKITGPYILQQLIHSHDLFKNEFFEIRSMTVNGKYAGAMLFVSPNRPMHLFAEGRAVRIPKKLEIKVKTATEKIVKAIDKNC
ncbi:MAG: hypothetical protein U9R08_01450 [Nanoarchaeota archaeon]|nr:hypothetical protein [Nanoarchaeota archaeon]